MPVDWTCRASGVSLVVPYYHMISDKVVPHVGHLYRFRTIAEFKADLEFFLRHFEPVTLRDIVDSISAGRSLGRSCFHLTFDDGFTEMYDIVAPILRSAGVPATFFLNTAFLDGGGLALDNALSLVLDRIGSSGGRLSPATIKRLDSILPEPRYDDSGLRARILSIRYGEDALVGSLAAALELDLDLYVREVRPYLSSQEIKAMLKMGFTIGAHSHDHPHYSDLPLHVQLEQTRRSVALLQTRFGMSPRAFAFPHNDTGVSDAFFRTVFSEPVLDISFGTGGLVPHPHSRNIERVKMENGRASAAQILARQLVRATYFKLRDYGATGRGFVSRRSPESVGEGANACKTPAASRSSRA